MFLFDDKPRTDVDYASYTEGSFAFLDRSALPKFEAVRERLNAWFANYPENLRARLKKEFIKKDFNEAFFELYCHQRLFDEGWEIVVHPEVAVNGKLRTPDFFIHRGKEHYYVEATTLKGISEEEQKNIKRCDVIREKIVQKVGNRFSMSLNTLVVFSATDPNTKKLFGELESVLQKLEVNPKQIHLFEEFEFQDDSLLVKLTIFSKDLIAPLLDKKFALDAGRVVWGDNVKEMQQAIATKAKKYKSLPYPLIIMLNVQGIKGLHEIDVKAAIHGETVEWINVDGQRELKNKHNGLFSPANSIFMHNVGRLFFTSVTAWHEGNERIYEFDVALRI